MTPEESFDAVKPISANARRVLGVLVEKAKTTPDNYPLTASALISGCNQKSNRSPQMKLDEDDVLLALDELRELGAAREIQGSGRVTKYRHAAYEWLDLDNPQAAVMTELLLRGPQTVGELRTRASRMYALSDLDAAKSVVETLVSRNLVEAITPPGRGQVFAHKLYPPARTPVFGGSCRKTDDRQGGCDSRGPKKCDRSVDREAGRRHRTNRRLGRTLEAAGILVLALSLT